MVQYRLYLLDCRGEHIDDVVVINAASDQEAIVAAGKTADDCPRELWRSRHMLGRFPRAPRQFAMKSAA